MTDSQPWAIYYKQATENVQDMNASLLKHIEFIESENIKLTNALSEMQLDNKEKESSLDDAHKIITKLNEEYNRLMKEYKNLENYIDELVEENKEQKRVLFEKVKNNTYFEKIAKINESLKQENEKLKRENTDFRSNLNYKLNETVIYEKESKDNNNIINSLNGKIIENEEMIREKDNYLKEFEIKVDELKLELEKKNEQIIVLNRNLFESNIDKKSNIEEITKQAANTIKMFYNSINNTVITTNINNQSISSYIPNFLTKNELIMNLKENRANDLLNDYLQRNIDVYMENNSEYFNYANFLNDLLKSEVMSNYFREANIVNFIKQQVEIIIQQDGNNVDNLKDYIQKLAQRNHEAEQRLKMLSEKYLLIKDENTNLIEKITTLESICNGVLFNVEKINESLTSKSRQKTKSKIQVSNNNVQSDDKFDFEKILNIVDEFQIKAEKNKDTLLNIIKQLREENKSLKISLKRILPHNLEGINTRNDSEEIEFNQDSSIEQKDLNNFIKTIKIQTQIEKNSSENLIKELEKTLVDYNKIKDENETLKTKINSLENEFENKKKILKSHSIEKEKLLSEYKNIERELENCKKDIQNYVSEGKKKSIKNNSNASNNEIEEYKKQIAILITEVNNLKVSNSNLTHQKNTVVNDLNEQIKQLTVDMSILKNKRKSKQNVLHLDKTTQFSILTLYDLETNRVINHGKLEEQEKRISELQNENEEIRERYEKVCQDYNQLMNNNNFMINNTNRSLVINDNIFDNNNNNQINAENLILKEKLTMYEGEISTLKKKLEEITKPLIAIETKVQSQDLRTKLRKFKRLNFVLGDAFSYYGKVYSSNNDYTQGLNAKSSNQNLQIDKKSNNINFSINVFLDIFNEYKNAVNSKHIGEIKSFLDNYQTDMEKVSNKINEILKIISESELMNENIDRKVRIKEVKDILGSTHKFLVVVGLGLTKIINEFNNNYKFLKIILKFSYKSISSMAMTFQMNESNFLSSFNKTINSNPNFPSISKSNINSIFKKNQGYFINSVFSMFNEFSRCLNTNEIKTLYFNYTNKTLFEVIQIFKNNCETIKSNLLEAKYEENEIGSEHDEDDRNKHVNRRMSELYMSESYNIVDEKIIKLKKLEFLFNNLTEFLKHYVVVQDILVKAIFEGYNENNNSLDSIYKFENLKSKLEVLDRIIIILEETFFFKQNELDEDSLMLRKLLLSFIRSNKILLNFCSELN